MFPQQVKIFMDSGRHGVAKVEHDINAWLREPGPEREIVNTQTALCQVAESATGERFQCLVVTIWFRQNLDPAAA
jgi:hypothetical protein